MNSAKQLSLATITRVLSLVSGLALIAVIFLPIWEIHLTAPQYPEGLKMYIYSNKLGGEVEIINGLNHYIGMKELHAEDFIEFTVLPYILGALALFAILVAIINKRRVLYAWSATFISFGVLSMVDFYIWLYNYGHNLDPAAPIKVPGMSYQPPLIGFKQLLNFGAYSIPSIGGWIMAVVGALVIVMIFVELKFKKKSL